MDKQSHATSPSINGLSQGPFDPTSRIRPRRPCDSCRKRKSRCEFPEGATSCVLCQFHHQSCTFIEEPRPRKRRIVATSEEDSPQSSLVQSRVPRRSFSDRQTPPAELLGAASLNGTGKRDQLPIIRQDVPVNDYAELKGPSLLKKTLGLQNHRHSKHIGSTSEFEHCLLELEAYNDRDEIALGPNFLRRVNDTDNFILLRDDGTRNHAEELADLDAIETIVAPHGQALIHLYFRIVHPSFPILHKRVFLEKYQRTHREFSPPLLAAVYLLALHWWSYSAELALMSKPDVSRLEKMAFKTMNDVIYRPKLSTIQAGLLLLQRPGGDSWALTTQLTGLAQDLGLHLDCSRWKIPTWERRLRKRLAWGLYMQDKWGALVNGRPSHIHPENWAVKPLTENDFPERSADEDDEDGSTEVEKGRVLFCEMIKLTEIVATILSTFYTLRAEAEVREHAPNGIRWILERAKPIQLALREWHSQLPQCLKMEALAMRKLSSTGYLHLSYYTAEITLHRRIIRSLTDRDDTKLAGICRAAAKARLVSAIDFVKDLKPEHLQSFWYSASQYCFAVIGSFVSLLWLSAPEKEEQDFYKGKLDEYRWILRLSSRSAEFLERAINMLTTSTGVLIRAASDKPSIPMQAIHSASPEELEEVDSDSGDEDAEESQNGAMHAEATSSTPDAAMAQTNSQAHTWFDHEHDPIPFNFGDLDTQQITFMQTFFDRPDQYLAQAGMQPNR